MQVDFYHLAGAPVERVLPRLAERVVSEGGRLLVVADDEALARRIDLGLWDYRPDAFLPHGGAVDDPVMIAAGLEPGNGARNVALADGVWRPEALGYDRAFLLFGDERIEGARIAWRTLAEVEGLERRFWKQGEAGRWSRQA